MTERVSIRAYEIDTGGLRRLLSYKEREELDLDDQVILASKRIGFDIHDLTHGERDQVYNRFGVITVYCAGCQYTSRIHVDHLDDDGNWLCVDCRPDA